MPLSFAAIGRGFDQSLIKTTHIYTTKQLHGIKGRMARKNPTSPLKLRVFSFPCSLSLRLVARPLEIEPSASGNDNALRASEGCGWEVCVSLSTYRFFHFP